MVPFLLFYGMFIFVLVPWSFGVGIMLLGQAKRQTIAERRQTLSWAGGNLIEPAINMILVGILLQIFVHNYISQLNESFPAWRLLPRVLPATLPILVLLKPLLGWNSADEPSRTLNRTLVWFGLLRWGATILGLIFLPAVFVGILMLFVSLLIIQSLADDIVNPKPVHGIVIGLGPEGLKVAQVQDFSREDHPGITF